MTVGSFLVTFTCHKREEGSTNRNTSERCQRSSHQENMGGTSEVKAAGLVIFRRVSAQIEYLLLQASRKEAHWTPPKGHVDPGESDLEAAIRETHEEAGLDSKQFTIIENFQKILKYTVNNKPKTVVYWPAEVKDPAVKVTISDEHVDFRWSPLAEACSLASFSDMISTLHECEEFLKKYYQESF